MISLQPQDFNKSVRAAAASEHLLAATKAFLEFVGTKCARFGFRDLDELREYLRASPIGQAPAILAAIEEHAPPARDPLLGWPIGGGIYGLDESDYQSLRGAGIVTFGDLVKRTRADLLVIDGIGAWTIGEIEQALEEADLYLATWDSPPSEDHPIYDMFFTWALDDPSTKLKQVLRHAGVVSIGDLVVMTEDDLLAIYGFGPSFLQNVIAGLDWLGLSLANHSRREAAVAA